METSVQKNFLYDTVLPRVEAVSWVAAFLGFGLKWALQPAGSVLLTLGLLTLATAYYLRAFAPLKLADEDSKEYSSAPQLTSVPDFSPPRNFLSDALAPKVLGISAAVVLVGVHFKLSFLPGNLPLLVVGTIILVVAITVSASSGRLSRSYVFILLLGAVVWAVPSETMVRQFHRNDPVMVEKMLFILHHPNDRAAAKDLQSYQRSKRGR